MAKSKSGPRLRRPRLTADSRPQAPRRICIIVRDLYATDTLSDAGANALGLAQHLAGIGEIVTLLWAPLDVISNKFDVPTRTALIDRYANAYLIRLHLLVDVPELSPHLHCPEKVSLAVYHYLKTNEFDEVYCSVEGGLPYYTQMAIELGLFVPSWPFIVLIHTPTQWLREADKTFVQNVRDIAVLHMERYSIESAARGIFFSDYVKSWCIDSNYKLPQQHSTLPWFLPDELLPAMRRDARTVRSHGTIEIGVWPGWEYHRGFLLLCDVLDKLAETTALDLAINCFGPFSRILGDHTGGALVRRGRHWPFAIRFFPKLSERESLQYLIDKGGVAILPEIRASGSRLLHACLVAGIPVIASSVGSNPEMVQTGTEALLPDARADELAARIAGLKADRQKPLSSRFTGEDRRAHWGAYRRNLTSESPRSKASPSYNATDAPLVSIVMAHYERPQTLIEAIRSVEAQDYPNIEVVLVDDGSRNQPTLDFLQQLECDFQNRGWKIIRQKNQYLGAARNAGIRASSGSFILFLDDDNALLEGAVSAFVTAMTTSAADICTSMSKIFVGPLVPDNLADGEIEYVPLGGSIDFAFLHNTYGDANAMIRRSVFDTIGFLNEDYGFVASDWEFFARAEFHGLKIRIIPDATYWYRSAAEGMFRSAHWYDTRLRILDLFRKNRYQGLSHIYELLISQNIDASERYSLGFRLRFDPANRSYEKLNGLDPESGEALQLLGEIAASEGRPDTALTLLGQFQDGALSWRASRAWSAQSAGDAGLAHVPLAPADHVTIDAEMLRQFSIASTDITADVPLAFVEPPDRLCIQSSMSARIVATLPAGIPVGALGVRLKASLAEQITDPLQVLVAALSPGIASLSGAELSAQDAKKLFLASSGWQTLNTPFMRHTIEISFAEPAKVPCTLAIISRPVEGRSASGPSFLMFEQISYLAYRGLGQARRPRKGPPPPRTQARQLTDEEVKSAQLATRYIGEEDLLVVNESEPGFALKPSRKGIVVAALQWAFPAFARGVLASVEIANDNAASFEFALSLARPTDLGRWTIEGPLNNVAFSGWHRVDRKFELHNISVGLEHPHRYELSICAAIRLPPGAEPDPSDAYWRNFVIRW